LWASPARDYPRSLAPPPTTWPHRANPAEEGKIPMRDENLPRSGVGAGGEPTTPTPHAHRHPAAHTAGDAGQHHDRRSLQEDDDSTTPRSYRSGVLEARQRSSPDAAPLPVLAPTRHAGLWGAGVELAEQPRSNASSARISSFDYHTRNKGPDPHRPLDRRHELRRWHLRARRGGEEAGEGGDNRGARVSPPRWPGGGYTRGMVYSFQLAED
jgi:hypothetical protein